MEKLVVFSVENEVYTIYGECEIEEKSDYKRTKYLCPEFFNLKATKKDSNHEEVDFKPNTTSWSGHKFDVEDMITDYIFNIILGTDMYNSFYIDEKINKIFHHYNHFVTDPEIVEFALKKYILSSDMYNLFELSLVTDMFTYYMSSDEIIMINTRTHDVISNNYFAEVGFWESVENIKTGKEKLLWGTLPEEE